MSSNAVTLREVIETLESEGLLGEGLRNSAASYAESHTTTVQPWFIRVMVGLGAWLASLLLIGFVTGLIIAYKGGYSIVGLVLIGSAVFARRQVDNDFAVQSALAASLAGQVLFATSSLTVLF